MPGLHRSVFAGPADRDPEPIAPSVSSSTRPSIHNARVCDLAPDPIPASSRAGAGGEHLGLTSAASSHKPGAANGQLSRADDATGKIELAAVPRSVVAGIEIVESAGSEGGSVAGGEISSAKGGGTEGPLERGTPKWIAAPHPAAQGPPGGGTEIQTGAEPAEELPDEKLLQRDE